MSEETKKARLSMTFCWYVRNIDESHSAPSSCNIRWFARNYKCKTTQQLIDCVNENGNTYLYFALRSVYDSYLHTCVKFDLACEKVKFNHRERRALCVL